MKIIHTADWHLCNRLNRIDRTADLMTRVRRVAEYCEEHSADVLVVSGDLFCDRATNEQMTDAFRDLHDAFKGFFKRGGILLAVTGNHDRDNRLDLMRAGMMLAAPQGDRTLVPGRMYLFNRAIVVEAQGSSGQRVQFVCVPYPFNYRYGIDASIYPTREEQFHALQTSITDWMRNLTTDVSKFNSSLPTVLVAHLHVLGSEVHSTYQLNPGDDIEFAFASLNPSWRYIALGHIHKPQMLGGCEHVRYSGSLDRLDFGEGAEGHGALLVTIDDKPAAPIHLPIPCTAFTTLTLDDPAGDLHAWAANYPDAVSAIVRVRATADTADRSGVSSLLHRLFPRLHRVEWPDEAETMTTSPEGIAIEQDTSPASVVRRYLEEQIPADDPDRAELLALAEVYLTKGGDA